jgi:hypothetical protein
MTSSMHIALAHLKLDELIVVYPGERRYPLPDRVAVVPLSDFARAEPLARRPAGRRR